MRSLISSSMDPGMAMFRANFNLPASSKNIFIRNIWSTTLKPENLSQTRGKCFDRHDTSDVKFDECPAGSSNP